jgi:hypothetical protein
VSSAGGWSLVLSVVGSLQFDGRDVAVVLVEAAVVHQSTHSAVASSTSSMARQGLRGLMSSVLYRPLIVSARAVFLVINCA